MDFFGRTEFEKAIREGNIENVKRLTRDDSCDVNQNIGHEKDLFGKKTTERPLYVSLRNIKSKEDEWFQMSELLLEHTIWMWTQAVAMKKITQFLVDCVALNVSPQLL